jgi:hypothetical protein
MSTKQYTIRNVPQPVDRYLRKRAKISGKSLNQVIIDELSEKAGIGSGSLVDSLDWFIGSGQIGDDVLKALEEDDKIQKDLTRKQWELDDSN